MNKPITEEITLEYADKMLDEAKLKTGLVVRKLLKSGAIDLSDYEGMPPYTPCSFNCACRTGRGGNSCFVGQ